MLFILDADAEKEDLGLDRTVSGANSSAMQSTGIHFIYQCLQYL